MEFSVGLTYTGTSRVKALKDLVFYPTMPDLQRIRGFQKYNAFINKCKEENRLAELENIFVESIKNIPKPNYSEE